MPFLAQPIVWPGPVAAAPALPRFRVEPAVGGPQSTFRVVLPLAHTGSYRVSLTPRCKAARPYPWTQRLQLAKRDWTSRPAVLQFARPLPGWCTGRFRATVWANNGTGFTRVGSFRFTVRPGEHTALPERPCRPAGSQTLAEDGRARVFTIRTGKLTFTDGCLFASRMHVQIGAGLGWGDGTYVESDAVSAVRFNGAYVSYELDEPGPADPERDIVVTDLRTGARRFGFSGTYVENQVLSATGAVAWIGTTWDDPVRAVRKLDAGGMTILDHGPDIDPQSLRLTGHALRWTNGGLPEVATL